MDHWGVTRGSGRVLRADESAQSRCSQFRPRRERRDSRKLHQPLAPSQYRRATPIWGEWRWCGDHGGEFDSTYPRRCCHDSSEFKRGTCTRCQVPYAAHSTCQSSPRLRYIRMMSRRSQGEANPILDPVLEAAMNDLTSLVYDSHVTSFLRPRQLTTHFHLDGPPGTGRAACVAMFKHLKHVGLDWDTGALVVWATRRGWVAKDISLLREFGDGIQSGTRFHTDPQPWALPTVESWLRGVPMKATAQPNRRLKKMSCCQKVAERPPSRAEKMARSSARFTRK
jgi:hypothetical protein